MERLQRADARRQRILDISNKKRSLELEEHQQVQKRGKKTCSSAGFKLNKFDPIMLCPVDKKNIWKFIRPNGSAVVFNLGTLVDYVLVTGDFSDPETRIPFSDNDLKEIDELTRKAGLRKSSVLEAKRAPQAYIDSKFRRDALLGLERCAGEVVTDILNIIETCDPDEAQMRLLMRELPAFSDYYQQLHEADPAYARAALSHWIQFVEGPPNCPNDDDYGLIDIVCAFLRMCDNGGGGGGGSNGGGSPIATSSSSSSSSSSPPVTR